MEDKVMSRLMILEYEPIGKVKKGRVQYWKDKAVALKRLIYVTSAAMFLFGLLCGSFLTRIV